MRIAQVAPLYEAVPPLGYGGTERVIKSLCDGFVDAGHDVTLFASGESVTRAHLEEVVPAPLRVRMSREEMLELAPHMHLKMLSDVYERADEFDVIHAHTDLLTLPFAQSSSTPTVLTLHGRLDRPHVKRVLREYPRVPLVSISGSQRGPLDGLDLNWAATVHNGLHLERYHAAPRTAQGYLAFVGRIHPEKCPDLAVKVARKVGRPLHVAAKIDPLDVDYYRTKIEPLFASKLVRFLGEISEDQKPAFYAGAAATLFPSDWPEPFGLVMLESMAAGTPVIALRRGAVSEIIVDGVTGFICDGVDDMVRAVGRLAEIDPDACRRHARRFSGATMCAAYERVYRSLTRPLLPVLSRDWPAGQTGAGLAP